MNFRPLFVFAVSSWVVASLGCSAPPGTGTPDLGTDPGPRLDAALPDIATLIDMAAPPMDLTPGVTDPGVAGDGNQTIGPNYQDAPELTVKMGVPRGAIYHFIMDSTTSKIFPGVTGPYKRDVWVYVPRQYVEGFAAPFMIVQDGGGYITPVTAALDTLINDKKLPAIVVVFINPGPGDGRGSERGYEYDTVSEDYTTFIETEVLPLLPNRPDIKKDHPDFKLTTNPEGRASMGGSSGGAAAFTMGWFRPDLYRRILTYSGTFVNQHPDANYPHGCWEYHEHLIAANPPKPLRVFLEVGQNDLNLDANFGDMMHNWVKANQAMAAALTAKGYHYRFLYALNAGHVDGRVVRQTLPETLLWLWRGYPI